MTSDQLKELLQRYLSGQATDEDLEFVEKWFAHTGQRDYALDDKKRAEVAARLLPRLHAIAFPEQAGTAHESPDETAEPATGRRIFIFSRRIQSIAAIFILLIGTATLLYYNRFSVLDRIDPIPTRTIIAG